MDHSSRIFVAGGTGMVGSAIIRKLLSLGYRNIISNYHTRRPALDSSSEHGHCTFFRIDLTRQSDVEKFFERESPEYVFLAAAKVGGILANSTYPGEFIYKNIAIQTNIIHASYMYNVKRLLFLGSSCIYPKFCPQPMREEYLLTGELEPTNEPYAVAKIAGIKMCQSYNRQYGTKCISVMPTNLYGPNDNFDLETSHVLPAMIRKNHEAKVNDHPHVTLWGTGNPYREFLHVDDLADACVFLMNLSDEVYSTLITHHSSPGLLNVGTGKDLTINELAVMVKDIVGYKGEIVWDTTKPDGTPRKLLDISKIETLGWKPKIRLQDGARKTYNWYSSNLKPQPKSQL